MLFRKLTEK